MGAKAGFTAGGARLLAGPRLRGAETTLLASFSSVQPCRESLPPPRARRARPRAAAPRRPHRRTAAAPRPRRIDGVLGGIVVEKWLLIKRIQERCPGALEGIEDALALKCAPAIHPLCDARRSSSCVPVW